MPLTKTLGLLLLPTLLVGCATRPSPPRERPRTRSLAPHSGLSALRVAERELRQAEQHLQRSPRKIALWKVLRRVARRTGQPHRELVALERVAARGRLVKALRPRLARLLRERARELADIDAPAAALGDLARADRLAPAAASQRNGWARLRDRLLLRQGDRLLASDSPDAAWKNYTDLIQRGVLAGDERGWREAASGRSKDARHIARALRRLAAAGPTAAKRLARAYLAGAGRDPRTLLAGFQAASFSDNRLAARLAAALSKLAPTPLLARACSIRRRPMGPTCNRLRQAAITDLAALRHWAGLCRTLHWHPGNGSWRKKVDRLMEVSDLVGMGPLAGLAPRTRHVPRRPNTLQLVLNRSLEAWAAGDGPLAERLVTDAEKALLTPGGVVNLRQRATWHLLLIEQVRRVRGPTAAWKLAHAISRNHPATGRRLAAMYRRTGALPAALLLSDKAERRAVERHLRQLGAILKRWRLMRHAEGLKKRWRARFGDAATKAAWAILSRASTSKPRPVVRALRLAARGRLYDAIDIIARHPGQRLWLARLLATQNRPREAHLVLMALRHSSPGGVRNLPTVISTLVHLGLKKEAARLGNALYEREPTDPALLELVARGNLAAGQLEKAKLAVVDQAAGSGRPDRVFLTAARRAAAQGHPRLAVVFASRAMAWTSARPLETGLALVGYQWAAKRSAEARRTSTWLLGRWPAGDARRGVSHTLGLTLWARGHHAAAKRHLQLHRGARLRSLLTRRRHDEVLRRARSLLKLAPLAGRWATVAMLARLGQRRWKEAARWRDEAHRRTPRLEPLVRGLYAAHRGRLTEALTELALASSIARPAHRKALIWLAAGLASRAGKRTAGLLSEALLGEAPDKTGSTAVRRLRAVAQGRLLPPAIPWDILRSTRATAGE